MMGESKDLFHVKWCGWACNKLHINFEIWNQNKRQFVHEFWKVLKINLWMIKV